MSALKGGARGPPPFVGLGVYRCAPAIFADGRAGPSLGSCDSPLCVFYFEKIRVFKAGLRYEYISME